MANFEKSIFWPKISLQKPQKTPNFGLFERTVPLTPAPSFKTTILPVQHAKNISTGQRWAYIDADNFKPPNMFEVEILQTKRRRKGAGEKLVPEVGVEVKKKKVGQKKGGQKKVSQKKVDESKVILDENLVEKMVKTEKPKKPEIRENLNLNEIVGEFSSMKNSVSSEEETSSQPKSPRVLIDTRKSENQTGEEQKIPNLDGFPTLKPEILQAITDIFGLPENERKYLFFHQIRYVLRTHLEKSRNFVVMMSKREQLKLEWINAKEKLVQEIITDSLEEVKQEIEEDEELASRVGVELRHGRTEIRRKEYGNVDY